MTYPGGKNGAGIYQRIINHMPPHKVYVEAFLGSGAVMRHKRPAEHNIGIDPSADAIDLCRKLAGKQASEMKLIEGNALELLPSMTATMGDSIEILANHSQTLIYADPPYVMETRKGGELYDFEMTNADHRSLLDILVGARSMVMISGYRNALYDDALSHFTRIDYQAGTRRGVVDESLWMNFTPPVALHDYSHLGDNYRARERIKRKCTRWKAKVDKMDRQERLALMAALTASSH